jgi:hypothetical protein
MAANLRTSIAARNTALNAIATLANGGKLRIYDGAQPATPETAIGAQAMLAELTMNATAFGAAAAGVITAGAITADADAKATGTATWYRLFKSDGETALWDGSVGTSSADLVFPTVSFVRNAQISVTSLVYALPQ